MPELLTEVRNVLLLFKCILEVAVFTGLIVVPVVLLGYEHWKRRAL